MDLFGIKKRKNLRDFNTEVNLAVGAAMERFASASAEHFIGHDTLKKLSKSKVNENPDFARINKIQQAGFSAEVKHTARTNADNIINGSKSRIQRTDDVGSVNHTQFDHVATDTNGNPLIKSDGNYVHGTQQKCFSRVENYDKLYLRDYEHYNGVDIAIPTDQINTVKARFTEKIDKLKTQKKALLADGDITKANKITEQIERINDVRDRLKDSGVSLDDAMEARNSPLISTAKDIGKVAHKAGVESAKFGAGSSFIISTLSNAKKEDGVKATKAIIRDTAEGTASSYISGAVTSAVGGVLKSTNSQVLQNLSKKNAPAAIVQTTGILVKQTYKLMNGDITSKEFVDNVGQEGFSLATSMTGANLGAIVGGIMLPGVGIIVGGIVGGMVSSILSGSLYNELQQSINSTELSNKQREQIKAMCANLIEDERRYREEMIEIFDQFFDDKEKHIRTGFESISDSIKNQESIHSGLGMVADALGLQLAFNDIDDFRKKVASGKAITI
jgi:hypothetical protein